MLTSQPRTMFSKKVTWRARLTFNKTLKGGAREKKRKEQPVITGGLLSRSLESLKGVNEGLETRAAQNEHQGDNDPSKNSRRRRRRRRRARVVDFFLLK